MSGKVAVGRLADAYRIDVAYCNGQPLGRVEVEPVVLDQPDPDRLRPYIEHYLREERALKAELAARGAGSPC